jgi:hypothetical protein
MEWEGVERKSRMLPCPDDHPHPPLMQFTKIRHKKISFFIFSNQQKEGMDETVQDNRSSAHRQSIRTSLCYWYFDCLSYIITHFVALLM